MRAKVLIVPVYQKHWLYQAWAEAISVEANVDRALHWTKGDSLHERASLLGKAIGSKISHTAQQQWKSLQAADEGTFKNKLFQLAQWVLSQEDPNETFFKSIPRDARTLEVVHPSSLPERLVRRRMRRLALAQEHFHNRRILGWALATLPQLPLVITPFPNVTLYYTAYKLYSHYQALQGCRTLRGAFARYDVEERQRAAAAAAARAGPGARLRRLLPLPRLGGGGAGDAAAAVRDGSSGASPHPGSPAPDAPLPVFRASRELDSAVRPLERWHSPLSDEMALRVRDLFAPPLRTHESRGAAAGAKAKAKAAEADDDGDDGAGLRGGPEALPELVSRLRRRVTEGAGSRKQR